MLSICLANAVSFPAFQVGPTGFFAKWDDSDDYIEVTEVKSDGPANGLIEVGDKIYGVNGTPLSTSTRRTLSDGIGYDPRPALGNAITDSEAGNGEIVFDVDRGGSRQDITIQLAIMNTAYSATWPQSCPKSDLIVENAANEYTRQINSWLRWGSVKGNFAMLFLMATGEEAHLDAVRTACQDLATTTPANQNSPGSNRNNWYASLSSISLGEYYLRTGDTAALPHLQSAVNHAFETESVGGWGHGFGNELTGYVKPTYTGSGLVNAVGTQVFMGVTLARECGVTMTDADYEKSLRYFYQTAGIGAPSYGDHRPDNGSAVNGKASTVAAALALLNEPYASAAKLIAAQDGLNGSEFEYGHGGNFGNVLWRAISSGLIPPEREDAYRFAMDEMRWYLELCRSYNGTFTMLPSYQSTRYNNSSWGALISLNYVAARNKLRMTGAPPTVHSVIRAIPEVIPKHHEYFDVEPAGGYGDSDYSTWMGDLVKNNDFDDIRKHMHHWHPKVRYAASIALGESPTNDNLSPLNSDGDPDNDLTDPAVDLVIESILSDDARVRTAGLKAITGLRGFFISDFADFKYDEDDYRRMAPYVLDILRDPDSDHWELDAATWAMVVVPVDIIRDNIDAILPYVDYEYSWWVRLGAVRALGRLSGVDIKPYVMDLLDAYVQEYHHQPRVSMQWTVISAIDKARPYLTEAELQNIRDILGDDLVGGYYPRDYAYQKSGGYDYDSQTLNVLLETFSVEELETVADDINASISRLTNPLIQGPSGGYAVVYELADWYWDNDFEDESYENFFFLVPGFKAILSGSYGRYIDFNNGSQSGDAEDLSIWSEDVVLSYELANGIADVATSNYFTVEPPSVLGPAAFPDDEDQGIHYELEAGSGTLVLNHGMNGPSADAEMTDSNGWSNVGLAPYSNHSLDANIAWVASDNPHLRNRVTTGRMEDRIRDGSYVTTCWIRLNDTLPNEDAHYVAFSALYDFDFGVRRLDVAGEWKNTLFFHSSNWGSNDVIYAMNDSSGRPDIFLEEGKNYFIMFERHRNGDGDDKTLLHLYEPTENIWLTSNGGHGSGLGNKNLDTRSFHVGIGSINSDVLDPDTRFPGLIDSVQMWSRVHSTSPVNFAEKYTLARQDAIYQVQEQPAAYLKPSYVDGISARIDTTLARVLPNGSFLTVYYGTSDGGMDPAAWDHSYTFSRSQTLASRTAYLNGLSPQTTYYARAYVQNPYGAMLEYWSPQPIVFSTLNIDDDIEPPVAASFSNIVKTDSDRNGFATLSINASGSSDNIGIQSYTWTDENGAVLSTGSNSIQSLEVPYGYHTLTLTVEDFNGNTAQSHLEIDVIYGNVSTAPNAKAGLDQIVSDYNRDGAYLVELDGNESGSNGITPVAYTWESKGQVIATGVNPFVSLGYGEHFVILTVEGADGSTNQDWMKVEVLSEREAIVRWTEMDDDEIDDHFVFAIQDFTGINDEAVVDPISRDYTDPGAPNSEADFWPFSAYKIGDAGNLGRDTALMGVPPLNFRPASEAFYFIPTGSGGEFVFTTEPIIVPKEAINLSLSVTLMLDRSASYYPTNNTNAKAVCTLDDNSVVEIQLYGLYGNMGSRGTTIESADLPDNTVSVYLKAEGETYSRYQWVGLDNIMLVGENATPATVTLSGADRIDFYDARLSGRVADNGKDNPLVKIFYGTTDRGESTIGWENEVDMGTRNGSFSTTVTGLNEGTTYYFRIYSVNSGGESFSSAGVFQTIDITAPLIVADGASDITSFTATLNGEVTDEGRDTPSVTIYYGKNDRGASTLGWDHSIDMGTQSGSFSSTISSLDQGTTYHYRVYGNNLGGSTFSDLSTFTTVALNAAEIRILEADTITATTANLRGQVTNTGGEAPNIILYYGKEDRGESDSGWDGSIDLGLQSGSFSQVISGLDERSYYFYRIFAENSGGGIFSEVSSFRSDSILPVALPAVSVSAATNVFLTSATLNGSVDDTGGENPTVYIYYGTKDAGETAENWDGVINLGPHGAGFSHTITDLDPYRIYYYRAYAENFRGGVWSGSAESFVTQAPGDIIFISVQSNTSMTAASWDRGSIPDVGDIAIQNKYLQYKMGHSTSFDADVLSLSNQARVENSITFQDVILYKGSTINQYSSHTDLRFDQITVHEGVITYRSGRSNFDIFVNKIVGDGDLYWWRPGSSSSVYDHADIICPDMTGFTGRLIIGGGSSNGASVNLQHEIAPEDASFAMEILDDGTTYTLRDDIAVTALTINGDVFEAGTYTLSILAHPDATDLSNYNGRDYSQFFNDRYGSITVTEAAPAMSAPIIVSYPETNITGYGATIHGEVTDTGGQSPYVTLYYGETDQGEVTDGWDGSIDFGIQSGEFSYDLSGLYDGRTYYYRLYAENAQGSNISPTQESFQTIDLPGPTLAALPATEITKTTAFAHGAVIDPDGDAPSVTIYYGESDRGETTSGWDGSVHLGILPTAPFSVELTGLRNGTAHYYRIYAVNAGGARFSEFAAEFTTVDIPAPLPTALAAASITTTSATLQGDVSLNGSSDIPNLTLYYGQSDEGEEADDWDVAVDLGPQSGPFDYDLNGLSNGTTYYYRFLAANVEGSRFSSTATSFTTVDIPPPTVEILTANNLTTSSANLRGAITVNMTSEDPNITIFYGETDRGETTSGWLGSFDLGIQNGAFSQELTGLDDDTEYYYRIYSEHSEGNTFSHAQLFKTLEIPPPTAAFVSFESISYNSVTINGVITSTSDPDGIARILFYLGIRDPGPVGLGWNRSSNIRHQVGDFSTSFTGLDEGTRYYTRIRARDSHGITYSEVASFVTLSNKPVVEVIPADGITPDQANLRGQLTMNLSGEDPNIIFYYGESDGEDIPGNWDNSVNLGIVVETEFNHLITGLEEGKTYYYRIFAENSEGATFSQTAGSFVAENVEPDFASWPAMILTDEQQSELSSNPNIDFDNDGLSMIKEFYFGRDPVKSDFTSLIDVEMKADGATITSRYERRKNHDGVTVQYEYSLDLDHWHPLETYTETTEDTTEGMERVTIEMPSVGEKTFIRIQINNGTTP
ncbi:DUF6288 domain-containing protein [Rubellicoccus peritrichatus]|uniref:DUF6288 domain-containing protein n=1 Tax=Rubellicoccus peritrichatus TaxID=3080537 RepID=A0AAQ3L8V3_9BACT|nr:DUF6288 domain-containing protein [Puniceicoccus sp. CR14]WOO41480.1 DUF6288 domain-containing protein [Puniceicoccus sp. CR14]